MVRRRSGCSGQRSRWAFVNRLLVLMLVVMALASCTKPNTSPEETSASIQSGGSTHTFRVEIADSISERQRGLMNREELDSDAGMLFVWSEDVFSSFWMKDTPLSLDILFINEDYQINFIAPNTTPLSTDLITPTEPFRYVLEVKSGFVDRSGVAVGDRVTLDL